MLKLFYTERRICLNRNKADSLLGNCSASPSVRRLARELGVEINYVRGSGQAGRITEDDLKLHVKSKMTSAAGNNF